MIRLLTPEDFGLWKALRLQALIEHPAAFNGSYEEESVRRDERWKELLESSYVFAYFDGETPVGMAGYAIHQPLKKSHQATVFTVYVNPQYRGRGVMDWLMGAIEYHARDHGVEQLHLGVGAYNTAALRSYERHGFAVYGTEPRALKLGGEYIDEHLMVKYL